ncbi:MAG: transcriptional regulator [Methanomicrobiales archaeon HGW-Methanomicrobiales-2]|jgi:nitrogen regulatory protein PII|nr:MAG: transcriptional regulator [Methanomicrobiales archaeon HGW-Methanomicrobiales-2]
MLHETSSGAPPVLMVTIFDRGQDKRVMDLFTGEGVTFNLLTLGRGTANSQILSFLGLGETEKMLLFSTMSSEASNVLLKRVGEVVGPDKPNRGIAFTLPVHSVFGAPAVKDLLGISEIGRGEQHMGERGEHDLIVVIANRGFADVVMETAKRAGATGGTVIHARGTGSKEMEKFFGVAILPEKDLILIVVKSESRCGIMEAIVAEAGPQTDARAVTFSLPVNGVVGMPLGTAE